MKVELLGLSGIIERNTDTMFLSFKFLISIILTVYRNSDPFDENKTA